MRTSSSRFRFEWCSRTGIVLLGAEVEGVIVAEGTFGEGVFDCFSKEDAALPGLVLVVAVRSPLSEQVAVESIGVDEDAVAAVVMEVVEEETSKMLELGPEVRWSQWSEVIRASMS